MTPEELAALFAPFLICWTLVFLTNISEHSDVDDCKEEEPIHSPDWEEGKTYAHIPHRKHHVDKERVNSWNVSNFFRGDTGTRKVTRDR